MEEDEAFLVLKAFTLQFSIFNWHWPMDIFFTLTHQGSTQMLAVSVGQTCSQTPQPMQP